MPRAKKTLAEADANAEAVAPVTKTTTSLGKSQEKENDGSAGAEKGGKATAAKKATTESKQPAPENPRAKDPSEEASSEPATSSTTSKSDNVPEDADGSTWVCVCRDSEDKARELDLDLDDEECRELTFTCGGGEKCMCMKPADKYPEHKWIMTKAGFELLMKWVEEQEKRDQDNFDMYIYNDFSAYGTKEVMDNMLLSFDKEFKKSAKAGDPAEVALPMWSHIEAMAFFLKNNLDICLSSDDSEGNAQCLMTMGTAFLTTISLLIKHGLFRDGNSTIRNLGFILSQFLHSNACNDEICPSNEHGWSKVVVRLADKHGVTITGVIGIEEVVDEIREEAAGSEEEGSSGEEVAASKKKGKGRKGWKLEDDYNWSEERMWKHWDWSKELARYSRSPRYVPHGGKGRIGGDDFDLTKKATMARAKKWAARYDL